MPSYNRSPSWVREVIEETSALALGKVLPILQLDSAEGQEAGEPIGGRRFP